MTNEQRKERYGIRNNQYSERHRLYGSKLYCTDADMIEANSYGEPIAIFETKFGYETIYLNSFQIKILRNLAKVSKLPLFILNYYPTGENPITFRLNEFGNHFQYYLTPANNLALKYYSRPAQLSEKEYAQFLYYLRGEYMPEDLKLDDTKTDIKLPEIIK